MTPDNEEYSPAKIAEEIGVGVTTLKTWSKELAIYPKKNSSGRNLFSRDAIQIFRTIKELRDDNKGFETIRRLVRIDVDGHQPLTDDDRFQNETASISNSPSPPTEYSPLSVDLIRQEIKTVLTENNELAERYAKATYTIGKLEERIKHQEEKLQLLPAPQEMQELKAQVKKLQEENERLHQSWWKKLFR